MRTSSKNKFRPSECNPYAMDGVVFDCNLEKPIKYPELNLSLVQSGVNTGVYSSGQTCIIRTRYKVQIQSQWIKNEKYKWAVTGATVVDGGRWSDFVEVETISNTTDTFTIECTVYDTEKTETIAEDFTHTRVER